MTKTLLDGPGRVLESVYPRFLVDLAQGDDARLPQAHQQQFRERLMQELLSRVQLQTWTNGGMLNAPLSLRLTLVEKLASKYSNVEKEVTEVMGGKVLNYRSKEIYLEGCAFGREEGREEGRKEGQKESIVQLVTRKYQLGDSPEKIAKDLLMSEEEVEEILGKTTGSQQ